MKAKQWKKLLITGVAALTLVGSTTMLWAESYTDPAPTIKPLKANGKKILFDNIHGQTAGAADWVIDGGFSDYAEAMAKEGYFIQEFRKSGPMTYDDLKDYDVFVIAEANIPFKVSEQEALVEYVENGGSIFFIADHYNADRNKNRWDPSEVFNGYRRGAWDNPAKGMTAGESASYAMQDVQSSNWLEENFGVRFRYNALGDITNITDIVEPEDCFGITKDVKVVEMHAGSTIAICDPTVAKGLIYVPESPNKWNYAVDQGVYNNGGKEEGAYVAIAKKGLGKVAFVGDSSMVEDSTPKYKKEEGGQNKKTYDGFTEGNDGTLLVNLTNWLAEQEDYTKFSDTDISLSDKTSLLAMEKPETSTEPQKEPWAEPSASYKWYDSSTFSSGAYKFYTGPSSSVDPEPSDPVKPPVVPEGKLQATSNDGKLSLVYPATLKAQTEYEITFKVTGQKANSTLSGYNFGIFDFAGNKEQIAVIRTENGSWMEKAGYGDIPAITTDAEGNGEVTFKVRTVRASSGAKLRIKSGKSNLITTDEIAVSASK